MTEGHTPDLIEREPCGKNDLEMGAAIAIDTAVQVLRLIADQAEAFGNRDTSSFIHAAATVVRGLDPAHVIARARNDVPASLKARAIP